MPLLPRHDPLRPLFSAARSARGIGILQICLAIVVIILVGHTGRPSALFMAFVFCCITGALNMILAHYIERSRRWALIAMIALASVEMFVTAPFFFRGLYFFDLVWMGIRGVFMAAFVILIVQLARSFAVLRVNDVRFNRGFAPVMPEAPATPPAIEGSDVDVSKT